MARNDVARRCFQSLANACLEEDIHDDGDGEGVSEKAKEALCILAAAQPLAVAVAVRTSLASDDIGRREGVGWRGVRRLLEAACCAARSVEAFAKHGSTPAGAGSKVTTMNEKEVDEAVDALAEAAVNELLQGAIENVADAVAVVAALAPTFPQPLERAVRGILALIEPGAPPSHHVLVAAGALASAQPEAFSRFSTEVLSLLLPSLGATKADAARSTTCDTLAAIAASLAVARDDHKRATEALIRSVMELLLGAWLFAGSGFGTEKLIFRIKVTACLGELGACGIINDTTKNEYGAGKGAGSGVNGCSGNAAILKPSLMRVVALCQSAMQVRPRNSAEIESANELIVDAAKAMHKYLDALSVADALDEADIGRLMPLLQTLVFASIQASSSSSSTATDALQAAAATTAWMRCHFELLRCTEVLAASQPDEVCRLLVSKVEGSAAGTSTNAYNSGASSSARSAAYVTIRHLAGRAKWEIHAGLVVGAMVAATTREVLPHMKVEAAKTITSLAYAGYFKQSGSSELALYLMQNTLPTLVPTNDGRAGTRKGAEAEAAAVAEAELREVCSKSLQLIVGTEVENTRQAVWPSLLHFMLAMQPGNDAVDGVDDALRCISGCSAAAMSRPARDATTDMSQSIGISAGTESNNGNAIILVRLISLLHQLGARRAMLAGAENIASSGGASATKEKTGHARLRALRKKKLAAVQSTCENLLSCAESLVKGGVILCVGAGGSQIEDTIALLRSVAHDDAASWASGCDELLASIIKVNIMTNPAYACNDAYIRWVGSSTLSCYSSPDDVGGASSLRDTALHRMLGVLISVSTSREDATKFITCLMTRLTGYMCGIRSPSSASMSPPQGEDHPVFGAHAAGVRAIAEAVGRASGEYVDIVLNALRNIQVTSKDAEDKSSSVQSSGRESGRVGFGLFGGGRRTSTPSTARDSGAAKNNASCGKTQVLSSALQLCYAEVCRRCPRDVLLSRVQTHVLPLLLGFSPSMDTNRLVMARECILMESVEAVAESILGGQDVGSAGENCSQVHTCVSESVEKLVDTVDYIVRKHASLPSTVSRPICTRTGSASRSAKKKRTSPVSVLNGLDDEDDDNIDPGVVVTPDGNGHDDEVNAVGSIDTEATETVAGCLSCLGKLCRLGLGLGSIQRANAVRTCIALLESDGGSDDATIVTAIVDFVGGIYTKSLECIRDVDDADILSSLVGALRPLLSASKNTTRANAWKLLFLLLKACKSYSCGNTKGARTGATTTSTTDVAGIFGTLAAQSLARGCDDRSAPVRKFALKSLNALVDIKGTPTAREHSEPLKAAITSLSGLDFLAFNDDSKDVGGADFFDALQPPLEACMRSLSAIILAEDDDSSISSVNGRVDSIVDFCSSAALGIGDTSFCASCCSVMMLTILIEQHGSVLINTGAERIVRDCISGSSHAQFERARVGGINALRFLCQVCHKHQLCMSGIISQLLTIEDESATVDRLSPVSSRSSTLCYDQTTVHRAFQNLASSKSIGAEASLCVLNVLMKSRLLDGIGDANSSIDVEDRKQNAAARVLRALLETPKGAPELLLSRKGELMTAVMMRYWMARDAPGAESCRAVLDNDDDVGEDANATGFSCSSGGASSEMTEAAMLLRAYVGATMTQLAGSDTGEKDIFSSKKEDIVNLIVRSHMLFRSTATDSDVGPEAADDTEALATIQEIFTASKALQRRPLAACRELAACVIGCIGKNISACNEGELPAGVDGILQHVIESLSMAAGDSSVSVRCHALTGLASIVRPSIDGNSSMSASMSSQIALVNSQVIGLLHRCCDDESYDAVIAGLTGIAKIFKAQHDASASDVAASGSTSTLSDVCMGASLSPLPTAMRVRRCFVSGGARVRAAALTTFAAILGTVTDDIGSGGIESWRELVHDSLSVVILLVNDATNAGVRKAAKNALRASVMVLSLRGSQVDGANNTSSSLSELVSGPGLDPDKRLQYAGFLKSISAIICRDYASEVDAYLKNVLNECRRGSPLESNALLFGAHLLIARGRVATGGDPGDSRTSGSDTASKSASTSFSHLLLERLGSEAAFASACASTTRKGGMSLMGGGTKGGGSSTRQAAVAALSVLLMDDM